MILNYFKKYAGLEIVSVHYDMNDDGTYCMTEIIRDGDGREMEIKFPSVYLCGEIMGWEDVPYTAQVCNEYCPDKDYRPRLFPFIDGCYKFDEHGNYLEIREIKKDV